MTLPRSLTLFAVVSSLASTSGCIAISQSEARSEARATVIIRGDGTRVCAAQDGGAGGDSAWVIVRSGEEHSSLYTDAVLGSIQATAGAGGAGGQSGDAELAPASPGLPGEAGGVEIQPIDCDLSNDPVDPNLVQILSTPTGNEACVLDVDTEAGTAVRVGVPGEEDILPTSATVVVETFHIGPGAVLAVEGDLTVYAETVTLESGARLRSHAGESFRVLDREEAAAAADAPGTSGGWLTIIAEQVELGGTLETHGNPGAAGGVGGDGGRLVLFAGALSGTLGAELAFGSSAFDASGGTGGDGADTHVQGLTLRDSRSGTFRDLRMYSQTAPVGCRSGNSDINPGLARTLSSPRGDAQSPDSRGCGARDAPRQLDVQAAGLVRVADLGRAAPRRHGAPTLSADESALARSLSRRRSRVERALGSA